MLFNIILLEKIQTISYTFMHWLVTDAPFKFSRLQHNLYNLHLTKKVCTKEQRVTTPLSLCSMDLPSLLHGGHLWQ